MIISNAQLHSAKAELRFCLDSNPAPGMSEICDGEIYDRKNHWQWYQLEIRLNSPGRSTIPQKSFNSSAVAVPTGVSLETLSLKTVSK